MKSLTLTRGAALAGALTLAHASAASADGENTPLRLSGTTSVHVASSGGTSGIVRTIVGLFIVIAVIYGVSWILRQAKGGGKSSRASGQGLSQLASLPLGSGRSVALVRAGEEIVLIGIAEHGITPIRTYTEAEAVELGLHVPEEDSFAENGSRRGATVLDVLRRLTVRS